MIYIRISNDIITGIYCGEKPDGTIEVPDYFSGVVGQSIKEFDEQWNLLPLSIRYERGYIKAPDGFRLDGDKWKELTQLERWSLGIEAIPVGMKIENDELIPMTNEEKLLAGLLTEQDIRTQEIMEIESYLANTDWYAIRFAETGKSIPVDVIVKRQEARDRISELNNQ